jgi:alpha-methylacyl-CoA racemase
MSSPQRFLDGLRVIDLTRLLPGPFATMLLGDLGADVIKVEDPGVGDYARYYPPMVGSQSAFFQSVNRNKRFVTLNLKTEAGQGLLHELLASADVLMESFRPGVISRLGFDPQELGERYPGLIIASISGYGQTGPRSQDAGHDLNYLALSGVLGLNGPARSGPSVPGFQLADLAGGALYAALGVTSALVRRGRTGEGAHLDISMTEGALSFMIPTVARHGAGEVEVRGEGFLTGGLPCYRVYRTADDRYLAVGALEPKFWDVFVEAIGLGELKGKGLVTGEEEGGVARTLQRVLMEKPMAHWEALLSELDVCVEPVRTLEETLADELHRARKVFFELQGVRQVCTPLTPRDADHRPAGEPGRDNVEVFGELGIDADRIEALRASGVV